MKHIYNIYKLFKRRSLLWGPMGQVFPGDQSLLSVLVDPVDRGLQ